MTEYKDGEKSLAICHDYDLVGTTCHWRNLTVEEHNVHILAGVCDKYSRASHARNKKSPRR